MGEELYKYYFFDIFSKFYPVLRGNLFSTRWCKLQKSRTDVRKMYTFKKGKKKRKEEKGSMVTLERLMHT